MVHIPEFGGGQVIVLTNLHVWAEPGLRMGRSSRGSRQRAVSGERDRGRRGGSLSGGLLSLGVPGAYDRKPPPARYVTGMSGRLVREAGSSCRRSVTSGSRGPCSPRRTPPSHSSSETEVIRGRCTSRRFGGRGGVSVEEAASPATPSGAAKTRRLPRRRAPVGRAGASRRTAGPTNTDRPIA